MLGSGPIADWDARWDETGGLRLAVWIADPNDETIGSLSLYNVDSLIGRVSTDGLIDHQPAASGFSIGKGRLAWIPGQAGAGTSQINVLAWSGQDAGKIQSQPGADLTLIR